MRRPFITISILLLALMSQACNYVEEKGGSDFSRAAAMAGTVSYAMVQEKVFTPSCIRCHGSDGGVNLQSYEASAASAAKIDQAVFAAKSMPRGGAISSEQLLLLRVWLNDGAPLGAGGAKAEPVAEIPLSELNYENLNKKIFKPRCLECHQSGAGVDLQTYASVKENIGRIGLAVFAEGAMPPKKPLTVEESTLLSAWIKAQAPEKSPGVISLPPTYSAIYAQVFQPLCLNCHGSGNLVKKKPLAPYSALMDHTISHNDTVIPGKSSKSALIEALTSPKPKKRMPPPDTHLAPLSAELIDWIALWIDSGAPEK